MNSIHPSILEAHSALKAAQARVDSEARQNAYGSGASRESLVAREAADKAFKTAVREHAPARELDLIEVGQGTCCCCAEGSAEEVWFQFAQEEQEQDLESELAELRWMLEDRAELLRELNGERSCQYGGINRDEIREQVAKVRELRKKEKQ